MTQRPIGRHYDNARERLSEQAEEEGARSPEVMPPVSRKPEEPVSRRPLGPFQEPWLLVASLSIVLGTWFLFRPYDGIVGDAILYIGHGLAEGAPTSVGRDLMFVEDGQFGFSLFNPVVAQLVRLFGPGWSSLVLVLVGQTLWLAAAAGFTRVLTGKQPGLFVPALIGLAVLPSFYGPFQRLHFAETLAVPRVYSEACVLCALTVAIRGRDWLAAMLLIVAAGLHPIMAIAGICTLSLVKSFEDRRWAFALGALAVLVVVAAFLKLPLAGRLFVQMDPAWRSVTTARNPLLFPSRWLLRDYSTMAVQAASLAIAAVVASGRCRRIMLAALMTAAGGLGCAYLFGDGLSSLLVIQAQPWRVLWLVAFLAAVTLVPTAITLWRAGPIHRVAVLLLLAAWSFLDEPPIGFVCTFSALLALGAARRRRLRIRERAVAMIAWGVGAIVAVQVVHEIVGISSIVASAPDHQAVHVLLKLHTLSVPVAVLAIVGGLYCATRSTSSLVRATAVSGAFALCIVAALLWDGRSAIQKVMESRDPPGGLSDLVAARSGAVLWLDGIEETTIWMRRANWYSALQGTSIVFSRPLAMEWARRRHEAARFGFVPSDAADLPTEVATRPLARMRAPQLTGACADLTGLAWIVLPIEAGAADPAGIARIDWKPTAPVYRIAAGDKIEWHRIDHYALVACPSGDGGASG